MAADDLHTLKRPHAVLDWTDSGPVAREAGDVYFSAVNGLEESRAVFLAGAGFPERFKDGLTVVGELGFGTGLNFLALWDSFRRHAPAGARLHFVSVEGFPLTCEHAARALSAFPELAELVRSLIEAWPSPHNGAHRRVFEGGRVTLTLFHDEAEAALSQMDFASDAWFLDGFAPAKNPDMWSPALFEHLARLSRPGALAATFTVAGIVRRGLAEAGFAVGKKPGFGRKRERLEAIYEGPAAARRASPFPPMEACEGPVAIIGGGIAAASLVEALSRRGRDVAIFARGGWAAGASSAPLGLLTPRLEAADRPHARALLNAFDYAADLYRRRGLLEGEGVLRLASDGEGADRLQRLGALLDDRYAWLDAEEASARTGARSEAGLWMRGAGTFRPAQVVAALAGQTPARDIEIRAVEHHTAGWRLLDADGTRYGPFAAVIVAGGHEAGALTGLDVECTAGRVAVFETSTDLTAPAAWGGYAAPFGQGQVLLGATHLKGTYPGAPDAAEAELRETAQSGPVRIAHRLGECLEQWGGVRAALADRLPVCGALPDEGYAERWRDAAQGRSEGPSAGAAPMPALLVLGGLGARGFAHAPLLAEHIAGVLCGEPPALENRGLEALHPARFAWRAVKRGG
jgi:tRNA 5-methylaminomethyl-2-thiouridine biosynthesis bifunctional protein